MPLIYITGPTAAGKTTLCNALLARGYEAHDADDIATWVNRETGAPAHYPRDPSERTREWASNHEFLLPRARIEELATHASQATVFLCGIPGNALEFADLYDRVICLVIDEQTMLERVAARTNNPFGKAGAERDLILRMRHPAIEAYRRFGAVMVDATRPVDSVVEEVLRIAIGSCSE